MADHNAPDHNAPDHNAPGVVGDLAELSLADKYSPMESDVDYIPALDTLPRDMLDIIVNKMAVKTAVNVADILALIGCCKSLGPLVKHVVRECCWHVGDFRCIQDVGRMFPNLTHATIFSTPSMAPTDTICSADIISTLGTKLSWTYADIGREYKSREMTGACFMRLPRGLLYLHLLTQKKMAIKEIRVLPTGLTTFIICEGDSVTDAGVRELPRTITTLVLGGNKKLTDKVMAWLPSGLVKLVLPSNNNITGKTLAEAPGTLRDLILAGGDRFVGSKTASLDSLEFIKPRYRDNPNTDYPVSLTKLTMGKSLTFTAERFALMPNLRDVTWVLYEFAGPYLEAFAKIAKLERLSLVFTYGPNETLSCLSPLKYLKLDIYNCNSWNILAGMPDVQELVLICRHDKTLADSVLAFIVGSIPACIKSFTSDNTSLCNIMRESFKCCVYKV